MKKIFLFLVFSLCIFSKNLELNLSEDFLNSFISAVGSINGKSTMNLSFIKIPYEWEISNARIVLKENKLEFYSDFQMLTKGIVSNGNLHGEGNIVYNQQEKAFIISLNELKVSGIEDIDLGEFYKPQFTLPMELVEEKPIKIKKENEYVELRSYIKDEEIFMKDGYIKVEANIYFEQI